MTKDIDDKSRVRLSLPQFWGIMVAVATATFVVAAGLYSIKAEQAALRSDFALYQQNTNFQIAVHGDAVKKLEADRTESMREWVHWKSQVNDTNTRQDIDIRQLQTANRSSVLRQ